MQVPVPFLEHARFGCVIRKAKPAPVKARGSRDQVLRPGQTPQGKGGEAGGGQGDYQFVLELKSRTFSTGCGKS